MKFLIDIELEPDDGGEPFTVEQVEEHLKTYVFNADTIFEMSLLKDDPDNDLGTSKDYRTYTVTSVDVKPITVSTH